MLFNYNEILLHILHYFFLPFSLSLSHSLYFISSLSLSLPFTLSLLFWITEFISALCLHKKTFALPFEGMFQIWKQILCTMRVTSNFGFRPVRYGNGLRHFFLCIVCRRKWKRLLIGSEWEREREREREWLLCCFSFTIIFSTSLCLMQRVHLLVLFVFTSQYKI